MSLGINLRRLRLAHGHTQDALAALADVSRGTIATLETGTRLNAKSETLVRLAAALGEPIEALYGSRPSPIESGA